MNLDYVVPGWWPWAAALFVVVAAVSAWQFLRPEHPFLSRRVRFALWTVRLAAGLLLLACILDWRRESSRETQEKPRMQIVVDRSASMATPDAGGPRFDAAMHSAWPKIQSIWNAPSRLSLGFAAERFSAADPATVAPDRPASALGKSLQDALAASGSGALDGVVLLTDGAADDPEALRDAARLFREAKVPVYPWLIGTAKQPADVRITHASLRQPSPSQPALHLALGVESPGFAGAAAEVSVKLNGQVLHRETIALDGKDQTVDMDFSSPYLGCHFYDVAIAPAAGEATTKNNATRVACDLRRDPIRVLYMEGSAPYETAYLRAALESDPDMEVTTLHYDNKRALLAQTSQPDTRVFYDGRGNEVPSVRHPTRGYPRTMTDLLKYDVVINSDIMKEAFTAEQLANTVAFVEEFGGGFVMVGGETAFGAGGYEKTVIDKLMPVEIAGEGDSIFLPFGVDVTEVGWKHPIMQVGRNAAETRRAWTKSFPGFNGANFARRAKPGAFVLARTKSDIDAAANGLVLFAVQDIGRGRTMAFMSDTTVSWGTQFEREWGVPGEDKKDETRYYRQFWDNAIRWLAAARIARKEGAVQVELPDGTLTPGADVPVRIPAGSAAELPDLRVTVRESTQPARPLPLQWNASQRQWEGNFVPAKSDDYVVEAASRNAEGQPVTAKAGVFVRAEGDETVAVAANRPLMEQLAEETGGAVLDDANAEATLKKIAAGSVRTVWKRSVPAWDCWWILVPILLLVVAEWILRRRKEPARA